MLAAVEEAEPLEPYVDVVLGELVGVDLLHGHLGELLDAVLHEQPHGLLLQLHLLLRVQPRPELLLEQPVPAIFLLDPRLQPICRDGRRGGGRHGDGLALRGAPARQGRCGVRGRREETLQRRGGGHGWLGR
jgi:hypothetical protein